MHNFTKAIPVVLALALFTTSVRPTLAQVVEPDTIVVPAASTPLEPKATFVQQLQQYYDEAKEAGTTTANSAAQWFGEQYESTTTGASDATTAATKWVTNQYNRAVTAGDTSAKSATNWVVDDISKIGSWEYKILRTRQSDKDNQKVLNELGSNRWQCFSVSTQPGLDTVFYFKRPHRSYLQQLPAKDLLRLAPFLQSGESPQ